MYTESKEKRRCLSEMTDRHTYVSKHPTTGALRDFKEVPYQLRYGKEKKDAEQRKICGRDAELFAWSKEHFAKYEDETVYTWDYGKTSWSTYDGKMSSYKYAMLPESEDQNENKQD